jgi:hypothetical protein
VISRKQPATQSFGDFVVVMVSGCSHFFAHTC